MLNPRTRTAGARPRTEAVVRYWGRKSRGLAELYISGYTKKNQVVADFFGGTGIFAKTALELCRRAIYVDLNPFAYLIAKTTIVPCDVDKFVSASRVILTDSKIRFKRNVKFECESSKFFSLRCKCGNPVEVSSILYRRRYSKLHSGRTKLSGLKLSVYRSIAARNGLTHEGLVSLHPELSTQVLSWAVDWLVKRNFIKEQEFPVSTRFASPCSCCGRDGILLRGNEDWLVDGHVKPAYWYPEDRLNYEDGTRFLKRRDVHSVSELFTSRNLAALSSIWHDIQKLRVESSVKHCLQLAFMATLIRSSKMCRDEGGTWPVNSYWIPRTYLVRNPYIVFKNAVDRIARMLTRQSKVRSGSPRDVIHGRAQVSLLLADSARVQLPKNSVDYVIVDPPHSDEAQFFELSLFYTSWLNRKLNFNRELIINNKQGKDVETYLQMLKSASQRVYESLRNNGHYTMILHDLNRQFLSSCVNSVKGAGFKLIEEDTLDGYTIYTFRK